MEPQERFRFLSPLDHRYWLANRDLFERSWTEEQGLGAPAFNAQSCAACHKDVYAEWKECRVGLDYHVEIEKHYYSVPHRYLGYKLWARFTDRTVEIFASGKRIACHLRSRSNRRKKTRRH